MKATTPTASMNRQESHRIYLQLFAPRSASHPKGTADGATSPIHRHGSHEIHPPNYPTTTPGAPYQFTSSSDSSQSSYSFSSLSTFTTDPARARHAGHGGTQSKNRFVGKECGFSTTSAAVRLTDKATAKDVTALLRGKFGLPSISSNKKNSSSGNHESLSSYYSKQSKIPTRLSQVQKSGSSRYDINNLLEAPNEEEEVDALVIIGTIEAPPKGYLRFEHEEFLEEDQRLEVFRHHHFYQRQIHEQERLLSEETMTRVRENSEDTVLMGNGNQQHNMKLFAKEMMAHLPVSESTATVRASGAQPGWVSSAMLLAPSASSGAALSESDSSLNTSGALISTTGAVGLDLSSSRSSSARGVGGGNRTTPWGTLRGEGASSHRGVMDFSSSRGKLATLVSELSSSNQPSAPRVERAMPSLKSQPKSPSACYEHDLEPIHIVRTVLPDEHPLHVRDKMMVLLSQLRQKAESEMGLHLTDESFQRKHPQPTFRWFFQPCSPLGGIGSSANSPKIQSVPAYIDVEGYCTEEESESDDEDDFDSDDEGKEGMDPLLRGEGYQSKPIVSSQMRQLMKEKRRIAMLRDLADPSFLVSGYLMKQSWRDPNVFRRVYCVLSEDRMWTIGRMKPLADSNDATTDSILSSIRVGRHKYIKLHRSLLLERGEGHSTKQHSSSRYSGYYLTPLTHRLPHTFRMVTSQGKTHTFRAFNSQSFRVWVTSLSEKIAQKHGDGMMDLANVIAEEETLARSRRMDDIAVSPIGMTNGKPAESISPASMDIARFGIAVAAFRELCRHVNDAIRQHKNHGNVVNAQTRVGGGHRMRHPSSPTGGQRAKNMEQIGMVSSVWEDARMVASKSAQLLHALATLQHTKLNELEDPAAKSDSIEKNLTSPDRNIMMEELIEEQKSVQTMLSKHWDHQQNPDDTGSGHFSLPPMQLFDPLLRKLQSSGYYCH
ncbi:hypothetical protein ACHAXR_006374 [Thalassiosira sp. AJA248-18]